MALTALGLEIKTFDEINADIKAEIRASPLLNPNGRLPLDANTDAGQIVAVVADREADVGQLVQAVYAGSYRQTAEGAQLDQLAALVNLERSPPSASRVTLTMSGVNGTIILAGRRVRDPLRPAVEWITLADRTISGGTATVDAQASIVGPVAANAGTITGIVTPVAGWTSVTNAADAILGTDAQTDESLRQSMLVQFSAGGARGHGAIRAAVLAVPGVVEAYVYANSTTVINASGIPPNSIEVVADGGDDDAVARAIYLTKAEGIGTHGAELGSASDENGDDVSIHFSRPNPEDIFIYAQIELDGTNPDAVASFKTALAVYGNSLKIGARVRRTRFIAEGYKVPGVIGIPRLGVSSVDAAGAVVGATTLDDVVLASRDNPIFSTINIVVEVVVL